MGLNGFFLLQKVTKERKQLDFLKKEIRDLSDQISDMQDDLQTLVIYDSGAFGMFFFKISTGVPHFTLKQ